MTIRTRIAQAALMLGLSCALLLAAEGVLRLVLRVRTGAWPSSQAAVFYGQMEQVLHLYRRHAYLNTAAREGTAVAAFGKQVSFNAQGYRSPARAVAKPPGMVRVLCSGGSTTMDLRVPSDANTWPWLLEGRLRTPARPVEVWNAGFPGWTSLENLISLEIRDLDLDADVLVLYQGINDLQPAAHRPFDREYEHGHAEIAERALGFQLPPLRWFERSLLYEKARGFALAPQDPWRPLEDPREDGSQLATSISPEGLAAFKRNVESILTLAQARGMRVLLVTQTLRIRAAAAASDRRWLADWTRMEPAAAIRDLEEMNGVLRGFADPPGGRLQVADLAADLPLDDQDFADPAHFTAQGSAKMAAYVAAQVAPLLPPRN